MWENIEVTGVGKPTTVPNERNVLVESNVGIYQGKYKATGYQKGRVYLTTHRICYVDDENPRRNSTGLWLSSIREVDYYGGFFKSSPKITLYLDDGGGGGGDDGDDDDDDDSIKSTTASTPRTTARSTGLSGTWVCPICYYANALKNSDLEELPKCLTCGIQAERKQIDDAMSKAPSPAPPQAVQTDQGDGFPCPRCTFNNHPQLTQCEMCGERLISPRLPPQLANTRADSPGPSFPLVSGADGSIVKLSFRGSGDKRVYEELKRVLKAKEWLKDQTVTVNDDPKTVMGPGLHGLQQMNEQTRQKTEQVLGGALEDLNTLMNSAKEVIKLAESYALHLEKEEQDDESLAARRALRQSSEALGLDSTVVTKEMSHGQELFHDELARQLAEFLDSGGVLAREGGVIGLVDLFAIFNRARGISLISPKDLYAACNQFERLRLPIRLREFKSGLLVVQESYRTPQIIIKNLLQWVNAMEQAEDVGVSATEASTKFGWSVTVAVEELEMAEQHGALCRDEQVSGTRFFANKLVPYSV